MFKVHGKSPKRLEVLDFAFKCFKELDKNSDNLRNYKNSIISLNSLNMDINDILEDPDSSKKMKLSLMSDILKKLSLK